MPRRWKNRCVSFTRRALEECPESSWGGQWAASDVYSVGVSAERGSGAGRVTQESGLELLWGKVFVMGRLCFNQAALG